MPPFSKMSDIARSPGDPTVIQTGPSSRGAPDNMARRLGWFSLALGAAEILAAPRLTRALGMEGREGLVRAFGVREIVSGMTCLSTEQRPGMWSRVGGDALDMATLLYALRTSGPKRGNVGVALAAVAGIALLDLATAVALDKRHARKGTPRSYADRSGWPQGAERSRGAAADFQVPKDMQAAPVGAAASPVTGATSPAAEIIEGVSATS